MKQFTVLDFINYNRFCFMCGKQSKIELILNIDDDHAGSTLNTTFYKSKLYVSLKITYNSSLSFEIDYITNRFTSTSNDLLYQFTLINDISINSNCFNKEHLCSAVTSSKLKFNFIDNFIKPIHIKYEIVSHRGSSIYQLSSDYENDSSKILICNNDQISKVDVINIKTKLLPWKKFKNKDELLEKIKLYALLS